MSFDRVSRVARLSPFVVVLVAPLVASGFGLVAVGHDWLGLSSFLGLLVPLTLDAAALSFAFLAWQATLDDEPAGLERLLVWVYAGVSAGLNVWHADAIGGLNRAFFFGAASLTAALAWERVLHAIQRRQLRVRGRIEKPAPRFRLLRWVLFPVETAGAFRYAVGEEISDPRTAIELYRTRDASAPAEADAPVGDSEPYASLPVTEAATAATPTGDEGREVLSGPVPEPIPQRVGCETLREAYELALSEVGLNTRAACEWLEERSVRADRSGVNKAKKRLEAAQVKAPHLVAVGEDQ